MPRKLNALIIEKKAQIIKFTEKDIYVPKLKKDIAKLFCIPPNTLSNILKNKDDIMRRYDDGKRAQKRSKEGKYPEVEKSCNDSNNVAMRTYR